jgi:hypothetical protein
MILIRAAKLCNETGWVYWRAMEVPLGFGGLKESPTRGRLNRGDIPRNLPDHKNHHRGHVGRRCGLHVAFISALD